MSSSDTLDGYLLKKEACEHYNRSLRQLARDFDKALVRGDSEFISNFKLRLEDGTVLVAAEVSKEETQKLRDRGLNPTWFVSERWMEETYGRRDDAGAHEPSSETPNAEATATESHHSEPQPTATPDIVASKNELIDVLREENQFLRESLNKERERSSDDRELTKQLHVLLKNLQDRVLPEPDRSRSLLPVPEQPTTDLTPEPRAASVVVQTSSTDQEKPKNESQPKKALHTLRKKAPSKAKAKRRSGSASSAKKKPAARRVTPKPAHQWYETPTLKRLLRRRK